MYFKLPPDCNSVTYYKGLSVTAWQITTVGSPPSSLLPVQVLQTSCVGNTDDLSPYSHRYLETMKRITLAEMFARHHWVEKISHIIVSTGCIG